jgi:hypothetical protein
MGKDYECWPQAQHCPAWAGLSYHSVQARQPCSRRKLIEELGERELIRQPILDDGPPLVGQKSL